MSTRTTPEGISSMSNDNQKKSKKSQRNSVVQPNASENKPENC